MDGVIYLLNQAGIALANANQEISELRAEVERLRQQQPAE